MVGVVGHHDKQASKQVVDGDDDGDGDGASQTEWREGVRGTRVCERALTAA